MNSITDIWENVDEGVEGELGVSEALGLALGSAAAPELHKARVVQKEAV